MNQLDCNVLHIEDDVQKVHDYIEDICKKQGVNVSIPDAEVIDDKMKQEGKALEVITGYWWASNLKEAIECIDRFTSNHILFDFVLIDRRLSDDELTRNEEFMVKKNIPNQNKKYLDEFFPWYSQAAFTGDFIFFYLTLIDKAYLRNIYFITGQDFEPTEDETIIKIWYRIAGEKIEKNNYRTFNKWCEEHYIMKNSSYSNARNDLIMRMSLPNAGICIQFREALDLFHYYKKNGTSIISIKYKNIILNLLMAAKQYDSTSINHKDLEELRKCLVEMLEVLLKELKWKQKPDKNNNLHPAIQTRTQGGNGPDIKVYSYGYLNSIGEWVQKEIELMEKSNGNIKPYAVSEALEQESRNNKYLGRIGYLINLLYHIQSESIHDGNKNDSSKVLSNTYIMHTCVFAFLELSRFIVSLIKKNTNEYCFDLSSEA